MSAPEQPTSGSPPPREEIAALRQIRESAQALFEQGKVEETWELLLSALQSVLVKNRELEWLVAKLQRERLGRRSERLDPGQLALLFDLLIGQASAGTEIDLQTLAQEDAVLDGEIASGQKTRTA